MNRIKNLLFTIVLILVVYVSYADEGKKLKVYVDSEAIDFDFLREKINYVDYVYDPQSCDVQIILLKQSAGNGGYKYAVRFVGKGFSDINNFLLNTTILPNDSEDVERQKLVRTITSGLFPFINEIDQYQDLDILVKENGKKKEELLKNNIWNNWVFNINGSGGFHKDENYRTNSSQLTISANQIKENLKIENFLYTYKQKREYNLSIEHNTYNEEDSSTTTTYKDTILIEHINIRNFYSKAVYSVSDHWSVGAVIFYESDSRINTKHSIYLKPAIEYNFYPWSKSNKIFLTAAYTIGPKYVTYNKMTINNRKDEFLWDHTAYIKFLTKQTWGEAKSMITLNNYLNQRTNYSLKVDSEVLFYLTKGLSLTFNIVVEDVNNQRYIKKEEYTYSEKLMRVLTQETGYYLIGSVGLTFRFGSLTNNIVNLRL